MRSERTIGSAIRLIDVIGSRLDNDDHPKCRRHLNGARLQLEAVRRLQDAPSLVWDWRQAEIAPGVVRCPSDYENEAA